VYACDGTPTDCVRVGLLGGLATGADLVVSGVNHGANLADDVTYSGTVGAGLEAAVLGTSGLCLSQQTPTGSFAVNYSEDLDAMGLSYDFRLASRHGAALAVGLARARPTPPLVLSVNYPTTPSRGATAELTVPGVRRYPRREDRAWQPGERTRAMYLFGQPDEEIPQDGSGQGTDLGALRAGRISVTPLSHAVRLDHLPLDLGALLATVDDAVDGGQASWDPAPSVGA
jgi:5'-nucleotidase